MTASIKEIGASIINLLDASSTTASSIAEMDATIKQVEKNAMETSAITKRSKKTPKRGNSAVEEAIAGMQAIRSIITHNRRGHRKPVSAGQRHRRHSFGD